MKNNTKKSSADESVKWLVITEKPSVAADITKAIGGFEKFPEYYESDKFYVTWAVGHILELLSPEEIDPKYKRWLIQDLPIIPNKFEYKPKSNQEKRLECIKKLANKSNVAGIVNACDAGREGELIFREIIDHCNANKPFKRLWLQSMTAKAIKSEFSKMRNGSEFDFLGDAARCRSESDWLIGINLTRAMTRRLATRTKRGEAWSIGRVQTPTLALIVRREMAILVHRAEPYWTIEGRFSTPTHDYSGQWFDPTFKKTQNNNEDDDLVAVRERDDRIFEKQKLQNIVEYINQNKDKTSAIETRKEATEIAPQLFDLTTLQREANRRFGMSASRTLQSAQRLYERYKLITYPRTDARYLPEDYREVCSEILDKYANGSTPFAPFAKQILKKGLLNQNRIFNDKEISDHFAIVPTGEQASAELEGDDNRIFSLIMKRFLAAFMPHAVWAKVERITKINEQCFRTRVQDLQEPGWREVYGLDTEEESRLPKLDASGSSCINNGNYKIDFIDITSTDTLTRPIPRLTEAKLLSLMEHCGRSLEDGEVADALREKGIGTPATRADIIENLVAKQYIIRVGRNLKPTVKGVRLVDIASRIPVDMLSSVELTGEMENDLKLMEFGKRTRKEFMKKMIEFTCSMIEKTKLFDYNALYELDAPLGTCPSCANGKIIESFWNYKCSNKECEYVIWKEKQHRFIDRSLVADVLLHGRVGPLDFLNPNGTAYTAWIGSAPKGLLLQDEAGNPLEAIPGAEVKIIAEYPIEKTFLGHPGKIIETDVAYLCEFIVGAAAIPEATIAAETPTPVVKKPRKKTIDPNKPVKPPKKTKVVKPKSLKMARMPKTLCGYPISLEEFKSYVTTGSTPDILDFKSKKGRPFGASLHMKPDASFEFKFVSRKKAVAAENANGTTEGENPAPKKTRAKAVSKARVVKKKVAETTLDINT